MPQSASRRARRYDETTERRNLGTTSVIAAATASSDDAHPDDGATSVGVRRRDDTTSAHWLERRGLIPDLEDAMLHVISPLTDREEQVISLAMDCAFAVHRETGPGFREKIYRTAYCLELNARGI